MLAKWEWGLLLGLGIKSASWKEDIQVDRESLVAESTNVLFDLVDSEANSVCVF